MRIEIKKWGNSKAIRLPKSLTDSLPMNLGDYVEFEQIDDCSVKLSIIPKETHRKPRLSLSERINMTDLEQLQPDPAWENMPPAGKESW
ncbi:AbrB/MazE/SpoVT family DNA-binding domain-containing protein [Neisseria sp. ZJ106]|uniref:AbrB/MazE/SpoVT family DNA-binding domain-containing protein n=1 Tax=Neisseria lisongii TaxID=2912188 RepID=A0ABY7RGZ2_9NEIS|nr:AbrB/MazE/SpoVT family DNA-binding domain-containing protein [Neisseria lisongii]MCF7520854.1 AbrB/MazE/SpoVT family DNA-binding domain-containing protein [Neisseria lisongii]WCL70787.1 AbrB/MazE/SpoVT family DNA-binding domain-containing protein [Neisseria lisongii]